MMVHVRNMSAIVFIFFGIWCIYFCKLLLKILLYGYEEILWHTENLTA